MSSRHTRDSGVAGASGSAPALAAAPARDLNPSDTILSGLHCGLAPCYRLILARVSFHTDPTRPRSLFSRSALPVFALSPQPRLLLTPYSPSLPSTTLRYRFVLVYSSPLYATFSLHLSTLPLDTASSHHISRHCGGSLAQLEHLPFLTAMPPVLLAYFSKPRPRLTLHGPARSAERRAPVRVCGRSAPSCLERENSEWHIE